MKMGVRCISNMNGRMYGKVASRAPVWRRTALAFLRFRPAARLPFPSVEQRMSVPMPAAIPKRIMATAITYWRSTAITACLARQQSCSISQRALQLQPTRRPRSIQPICFMCKRPTLPSRLRLCWKTPRRNTDIVSRHCPHLSKSKQDAAIHTSGMRLRK